MICVINAIGLLVVLQQAINCDKINEITYFDSSRELPISILASDPKVNKNENYELYEIKAQRHKFLMKFTSLRKIILFKYQ